MKKTVLFVIALLLFVQCASVKKHNEHLNKLISPEKLKSDVDFSYRKLQKLHPNLYWYISKKELDYKFDSLKSSISKPMLPFDFYTKLSPVIAAVREGHLTVLPPSKSLTKKQIKALINRGIGPFSQFDFDFFDNRLYVIKNKSYDKSIKAGSEVIAVNGIKPLDLIQEYNRYYSSDGYNTTLKTATSGKRFTSYFTVENSIKDSLTYTLKYNDSIQLITIKRYKEDSIKKQEPKTSKRMTALDRKKSRATRKKKRVNGYDADLKNYNRNLSFMKKDSSIAVMKIRGFKNGRFRTFYKKSFSKIEQYKSNTLILDLRDNGGGRLNEIAHLYSYLADSSFVFLDKSEVVSKSSLFTGAYFNGGSFGVKTLKVLFSPIVYGYLLLTVHKEENGTNYFETWTKLHKVNKNAFKGKIYVLINGGSFSASSILSTNLKGAERAFFVGQETGGAYNGTVAGFMPKIKLPNSEIQIRTGIMLMSSKFKTTKEGHGIYPDVAIQPTLEDAINGNDPALNWILKDIKSKYNPILNKPVGCN